MSEARVFGRPVAGATYKTRHAAYAIAFDAASRVACVSEESGLFLPGGGLEAGETDVEAVHREVAEECGQSLHIISSLTPAVQFFFTPRGEPYELRASCFLAEFGARLPDGGEHEVQWLPSGPEPPRCFHECHRWAVKEALTR